NQSVKAEIISKLFPIVNISAFEKLLHSLELCYHYANNPLTTEYIRNVDRTILHNLILSEDQINQFFVLASDHLKNTVIPHIQYSKLSSAKQNSTYFHSYIKLLNIVCIYSAKDSHKHQMIL